eukprot:s1135_g6.t1
MVSSGAHHIVLLRSNGSVAAVGENKHGQCDIPALDEGMAYTQVSAGEAHTVLRRSDGSAVAVGRNRAGQCDIPPLEEGMAYTQISAGSDHTVLLRSDGSAVAIGDNADGQCDIPPLEEGMAYAHIAAGYGLTVLLRSDGCAVAVGSNRSGQCNIPPLEEGMAYAHIAAGYGHTVLLRSDGSVAAVGENKHGQCDIPALDEGMAYSHIAAGFGHTVLLRSDGCAVPVGSNRSGQCDIPPLEEGVAHTQVSAGDTHAVLLRSDGSAAAAGSITFRPVSIPPPNWGIFYIRDTTCGRDLVLQIEFAGVDDAVTLICSTLVGEERCRLTAQGSKSPTRFARWAIVGQSLPTGRICDWNADATEGWIEPDELIVGPRGRPRQQRVWFSDSDVSSPFDPFHPDFDIEKLACKFLLYEVQGEMCAAFVTLTDEGCLAPQRQLPPLQVLAPEPPSPKNESDGPEEPEGFEETDEEVPGYEEEEVDPPAAEPAEREGQQNAKAFLQREVPEAVKVFEDAETTWSVSEMGKRMTKYFVGGLSAAAEKRSDWRSSGKRFLEKGIRSFTNACGGRKWFNDAVQLRHVE